MRSVLRTIAKASGTLTGAAIALGVLAGPAAAGEFNTAGRTTFGPCATVAFSVDTTTIPSGTTLTAVLADLGAAADAINASAGRTLVTVAAGTTVGHDPRDGVNSVRFESLGGSAGLASTTRAATAEGTRTVDSLIRFDRTTWVGSDANERLRIAAHEMGHVLGLGHVADAHEVMSYGFINDGDGLGPGTAEALRAMYPGTGCDTTPVPAGADLTTPVKRAEVSAAVIGDRATTVQDLAVDVHRYRTMANGSRTKWAARAVICRDDVFADCLGGSALAGQDGLLLFVPGGATGTIAADGRVVGNLDLLLAPGAPIYVLGGPAAVSPSIEATLASGRNVTRVSGPDRFSTAAAVAAEVVKVHGASDVALLARGDNPADAVAAGAYAARTGTPILLTPTDFLVDSTRAAFAQLGVSRTLVLGGEAAVSSATFQAVAAAGQSVDRVAGQTRFGTAVAIAQHAELWNRSTLTQGQGVFGINGVDADMWALALAAAPYAAAENAPVLLTASDWVPAETASYLLSLSGEGDARAAFVGAGAFADRHAQASFFEYAGMH